MTIVIIDPKNRRVMSDSRCTHGDGTIDDSFVKVFKKGGRIWTGTGDARLVVGGVGKGYSKKFLVRRVPYIVNHTRLYAIDETGVHKWSLSPVKFLNFPWFRVMKVEEELITDTTPIFDGSGDEYAKGAYQATGCTTKAREAAIELCDYCGGDIREVTY